MVGRINVAVFFGVLVLVLVPVGVAGGRAMGEADDVQYSDRSQEAEVSVRQGNGGLRVGVVARSGRAGGGSQDIVVRSESRQAEVAVAPLGEAEEARILRARPASGGTGLSLERELRIAREDIVAKPVGRISKERYKRLYKKAAKKYGFGEDWYVLAAVGWIESRHGENMGPSSAGAMGPMQFMPSTWKTSGLDGDRDGVKNVMDPEDAIPAAARYPKRGGAPDDWYAALFSYNHADWYVKDVLAAAERYRNLAGDERAGPYQ